MDGVAGIRRQNHVAGRGYGRRQVSQSFLGTQRDDGFGLGIDVDAETAPVIPGDGLAQAWNATRVGIAVGARIAHRFTQFIDDMGRRRTVRIAHAEVDDVLAGGPGAGFHGVDLGKHIGRQTPDTVEFLLHDPHTANMYEIWRPGLNIGRIFEIWMAG
jgi:hypothetical protein